MPIYEYYCPDNHTIYQFFAKTFAQGRSIPKCPDNPQYSMRKIVSAFAVTGAAKEPGGDSSQDSEQTTDPQEDARLEAAMGAMEREFASVDENDPRAMGRMMRRMAELTGEKIDGEMEEVVRKLEEGADPDSLEEQMGGDPEQGDLQSDTPEAAAIKEKRHRYRSLRQPVRRDPQLYDYT
jgi:hypothetical protein